jgi:outer membrane protein assembly factor BamD
MKKPYGKTISLSLMTTGIIVFLFFGGCAGPSWFSEEEEEKPPEELMRQGLEDMVTGYYETATESFQKVKDRYPYSKFAVEAELKMADALYKRELYDEAFDAYGEFERLHPKNANIPYVIYSKGMCHFDQMDTIDRDQSHTLQAIDELKRLVKKFPKCEYANGARSKIRDCYIELAEHELYVGNFYYRMGEYRAAMGRYRYILENYPDLGQYHKALDYLSRCKEKIAEEKDGT